MVDAVADQRRQRQRWPAASSADQQQADEQRRANGAQQPAQREARVGGPGRRRVDVRVVGGRRQRVDLGEQLGRRRHAGRARRRVPLRPPAAAAPPRRAAGPIAGACARRSRGRRAADGRPSWSDCRSRSAGRVPSDWRAPTAPAGGRAVTSRRSASSPASIASASSPGPDSSSRYSGQRAVSSSCVPTSTTRPCVQHRDPVGQRPAWSGGARSAAWCGRPSPAQRGVDLAPRSAASTAEVASSRTSTPRVGDQRPGQRDALALAAGQGQPLLADHGVVAVGQLA